MDSYNISRNYKNFVDISLAFQPNVLTGDLTVIKNERAINNSIQNLILTIPGEVVFQHDIGSEVTNFLFELPDVGTAGIIQQEIIRTIEYNEPRVELIEVIVDISPDQNGFVSTVRYKIIGYEQIVTTTQLLEPTR